MQYAIIRLQDSGLQTRDVFIAWIGPNVGVLEKGKKQPYMGEVKELLKPFHADLLVLSKRNLTFKLLWDRSGPTSGSHVID